MFILRPYTIQYLYPELYNKLLDYTLLIGTEKEELTSLDNEIFKVSNNQYIATADEYGIAQYEHLTRIYPLETQSLEDRRHRVLFRWNLGPVFTETWLFDGLDYMFGDGAWRFIRDYDNFTFYIEIDTNSTYWYDELVIILNTIKPCNMVYVLRILPLIYLPETKQVGFTHTVLKSEVPWIE